VIAADKREKLHVRDGPLRSGRVIKPGHRARSSSQVIESGWRLAACGIEGTGQMIEENESVGTAIAQERIDAVVGRARASAHTEQATQNVTRDTTENPPGDATGNPTGNPPVAAPAIEAIAVTEIPFESAQEEATGIPAAAPASIPLSATAAGEASAPAGETAAEGPVPTVAIPEPPPEIGIASGTQYRQDTRYEVEGDAEVFVKTGSMGTTLLRGHILDLSSTGCFIQTMARVMIKPGTVVQLIFSVYGTTFRIDATSRYARMRVGVGFRFLEMDEPTHKRLHAVLGDIRSRLIHENQPIIDRAILE